MVVDLFDPRKPSEPAGERLAAIQQPVGSYQHPGKKHYLAVYATRLELGENIFLALQFFKKYSLKKRTPKTKGPRSKKVCVWVPWCPLPLEEQRQFKIFGEKSR